MVVPEHRPIAHTINPCGDMALLAPAC